MRESNRACLTRGSKMSFDIREKSLAFIGKEAIRINHRLRSWVLIELGHRDSNPDADDYRAQLNLFPTEGVSYSQETCPLSIPTVDQ